MDNRKQGSYPDYSGVFDPASEKQYNPYLDKTPRQRPGKSILMPELNEEDEPQFVPANINGNGSSQRAPGKKQAQRFSLAGQTGRRASEGRNDGKAQNTGNKKADGVKKPAQKLNYKNIGIAAVALTAVFVGLIFVIKKARTGSPGEDTTAAPTYAEIKYDDVYVVHYGHYLAAAVLEENYDRYGYYTGETAVITLPDGETRDGEIAQITVLKPILVQEEYTNEDGMRSYKLVDAGESDENNKNNRKLVEELAEFYKDDENFAMTSHAVVYVMIKDTANISAGDKVTVTVN